MNKSVFGRIVFFLLLTLVTFFYMAAANNESLLKNDYSGTALRFGEDGVSAAQLDFALANEEDDSVKAAAFIQKGGAEVNSPIAKARVCLFTVHGDISAIMPISFAYGGYAGNTQGTCIIDAKTAYSLFGQSNAVGLLVTYNDIPYIISGVVQSKRAVMIVNSEDDGLIYNEMRLRFSHTPATAQTATDFCDKNNISGYVVSDGQLRAANAALVVQIPAIILILSMVAVAIKECRKMARPIKERIMIAVIGAATVTVLCFIMKLRLSIPLEYLPNSWSDFSHWSNLAAKYAERRDELSCLVVLLADAEATGVFVRCALFSGLCGIGLIEILINSGRLLRGGVFAKDFAFAAISALAAWTVHLIFNSPFNMPFACVMFPFAVLVICGFYGGGINRIMAIIKNASDKFIKLKNEVKK